MSFEDLRTDVAEIAAAATGLTVTSTWSTNPASNIGQVRWGGAGAKWFERDDDTIFGGVQSNISILFTANYADPQGATEHLEATVQALVAHLDAGQPLPRVGGQCSPVMSATEPARLSDQIELLATLVTLYPIDHHIP